eukprot:g32851.t1
MRSIIGLTRPVLPSSSPPRPHQEPQTCWALKRFLKHLEQRSRSEALSLPIGSVEISGTSLAAQIARPALVELLDWVANIWPRVMQTPRVLSHNKEDVQVRMNYPQVGLYLGLYEKLTVINFHLQPGGVCMWLHVYSGMLTLFLIQPTAKTLAGYERWLHCPEQERTWLGDWVQPASVFPLQVKAGSCVIIPAGWLCAIMAAEDTIAFGGYFIHCLDVAFQLQAQKLLEEHSFLYRLVSLPPYLFEFPFISQLHWFTLRHFLLRLRLLEQRSRFSSIELHGL